MTNREIIFSSNDPSANAPMSARQTLKQVAGQVTGSLMEEPDLLREYSAEDACLEKNHMALKYQIQTSIGRIAIDSL